MLDKLTQRAEQARIVQIKSYVERDHYIVNLYASGLSAAEKVLLGRLAYHVNLKTGQCNPGSETLAEETHTDERWVRRILAKLEQAGWFTVKRRPGYHSNQFTLTIPEGVDWPSAEELKARREQKNTRANRPGYDRPGCYRSYPGLFDQIPGSIDPPNCLELLGEAPKKEPLHRGEREAELALSSNPHPARGGLNGHAPEFKSAPSFPSEESKPATSKEASKQDNKKATAAAATAAPMTAYDELRRVWQRGHISDERADRRAEDRRAYDRACRKAAPDQIFAGALVWVQAADNPRFLPTLATWLDAEGWSKAPREKAARAPRQQRQPRRRTNGGKVDLAAIFFEQAGLTMDDDDEMPQNEARRHGGQCNDDEGIEQQHRRRGQKILAASGRGTSKDFQSVQQICRNARRAGRILRDA
jgi:Helix-turn-helix domain